MMRMTSPRSVRGFTLLELLVVVAILAIIAGLVLPKMTGVTEQAGNAANAALLKSVSEAESRYEAQFKRLPSAWDGVLDATGALYTKLHPKLLTGPLDAAGTTLVAGTLTDTQMQSLYDAGITGLHFQDAAWTGPASDSGRTYQAVSTVANPAPSYATAATKFAIIQQGITSSSFSTYGHNVLFTDKAFSINPYVAGWNWTLVVLGFGNEAGLKRNTVQDTPLFTSVDPAKYYARALVVFAVPNGTTITSTSDAGYFKARYVGCFAPDGTSIMDNLNSYTNSPNAVAN